MQALLCFAGSSPACVEAAAVRRFDRELLFPLPNQEGRQTILDIHTRSWSAPPAAPLRNELAALTVGFCGADLKARTPVARPHCALLCCWLR